MSTTGLLAIKEETTAGTYIAPDRAYPFDPGQRLARDQNYARSRTMNRTSRSPRTSHRRPTTRGFSGSIGLELTDTGFGLWHYLMLGANATAGLGPYTHTATPLADDTLTGNSAPFPSFSLHKEYVSLDSSRTNRVFGYNGCQVDSWTITAALDDLVRYNLSIVAVDLDKTKSSVSGSATYPSSPEWMTMVGCTATVDGNSYDIKSLTLNGSNNLKRMQYGGSATGQLREPGRFTGGGSFVTDFDDFTLYDHWNDDDDIDLVATFADDSGTHSVVITAHILPTGELPDVASIDEPVEQPFSFEFATDDDTDAGAFSLVYTSADSAI